MLSRALSLATVMLLIGGFTAIPAQAQNLEAGKSPSQIFAGTCNACHKSPRGLLKTVSPGSLPGFLRQHYTTSSEMASLLSAFLVSNGATDTRYVGAQPKAGKDAKPDAKPEQLDRFGRRLRPAAPAQEEAAKPDAQPQQAAKPDADGITPPAEPGGRQGRNAKRLARPAEPADAKPGKKGKPGGEEPSKTDAAKQEPSPGEPAEKPKSETAKDEGSKPVGEAKSEDAKPPGEAVKAETPKAGETPASRPDPVPAVTPPKSAEGETRPVQTATPAPAPGASGGASAGAASSAMAEPVAPPPAVTASAPPVAPAGPPAPPISQ